jgi:hypothetical protein
VISPIITALTQEGRERHSASHGLIMTKFDIIGACVTLFGACVTLFLLCAFIYVAKRRSE